MRLIEMDHHDRRVKATKGTNQECHVSIIIYICFIEFGKHVVPYVTLSFEQHDETVTSSTLT